MSSSIRNIRERLGGSQQWWADYLDITLGQLKMAEGGKRSLPTAALFKLSVIELLPPLAASTATVIPKAASGKSNPFAPQIRKLKLQLHRTQQLLQTMQLRYAQSVAAAGVAAQLLQTAGATEEDPKNKLLLEAMQLQADRNKEQYGATAQALLQWKLNCLLYAIAEAENFVSAGN